MRGTRIELRRIYTAAPDTDNEELRGLRRAGVVTVKINTNRIGSVKLDAR